MIVKDLDPINDVDLSPMEAAGWLAVLLFRYKKERRSAL